MKYPKVSVVIGSYNRRNILELCIEAVRKELCNESYEIIVVDGGSNDGAIEWLAAQKDIISIIQHNRGEWQGKTIERQPWAYFMNLAFKCASGRYICMLSDDSLIVPNAINNGVNLFDNMLRQDVKVGGVAFYFRDYPLRQQYAVAVNLGNLYVNHGLFLNAAIREVGYCDESYHFYFADTDLALKMKQAGYEIITSEGSFVEHYFEATPEIRASNNDERKAEDRQKLIDKWAGIAYPKSSVANYRKHVGHWQDHPNGFFDENGTIQKLINLCSNDKKKVITISVVTVVYNDPDGLRKTISSTLAQDYVSIEYIVVDGASSDDTTRVLKKYEEKIDQLISEPDRGIYDAMNKGIHRATGEYLIFLNAGDVFSSRTTLSEISNHLTGEVDVVYGHRKYVNKSSSEIQKSYPVEHVKVRMPFCHQSAFYRLNAVKRYPFNTTYKFAADYNQVVEMYCSGCSFLQVDQVVCDYCAGGRSESGLRPYLEVLKIQFDNFGDAENMKQSIYMRGFIRDVNSYLEDYKGDNFRANPIEAETNGLDHKARMAMAASPLELPGAANTTTKQVGVAATAECANALPPDLWRDILYADLFYLKDKTNEEKQEIRKTWLKEFLHSEFHLPEFRETDVVFFRSLVRDDYRELFHKVIEASGVSDLVVVEDFKRRANPPRLNPAASRYLVENWKLLNQLDIDDPLDRSCCMIRVAQYKFILDHFCRRRFRVLVCFADMQPVEHLLARYFYSRGVTTVTLQHGLYVDYGAYETVNKINYLHQPSEYFLAWGPETADLIRKHHPDTKVLECGKPVIHAANPPAGGDEERQSYIAVILDQKIFHSQNEEMLKIVLAYAFRRDMRVTVRFHPSLPKQQILRKHPDLREQFHFTDADIVVGHTSSLLYEAIQLGCRVMRFATDIPAIPLPECCEFHSVEEFETRVALSQPEDLSKRYFTAVGDEALAKYQAFFSSL